MKRKKILPEEILHLCFLPLGFRGLVFNLVPARFEGHGGTFGLIAGALAASQ